MINGAHVVVYSRDPDADRKFIREILGFPHVDAGGGWLIFQLPRAEVAVHPAEAASHELYLMCDDLDASIASLTAKAVPCSSPREERWARLTTVTLPGGGELGLYKPRHPRPTDV